MWLQIVNYFKHLIQLSGAVCRQSAGVPLLDLRLCVETSPHCWNAGSQWTSGSSDKANPPLSVSFTTACAAVIQGCKPSPHPPKSGGVAQTQKQRKTKAKRGCSWSYRSLVQTRSDAFTPHFITIWGEATRLSSDAWHFLLSVPQVGDFADANSWPTPGEIATKDMQVGVSVCLRNVVESWFGGCFRGDAD